MYTDQSTRRAEADEREMALEADQLERARFSERTEPVSMNVTVSCPVCQNDHVTARFNIEDGAPVFDGLAERAVVWWACRCRGSAFVDLASYVADVRERAWDKASEWLRRDRKHTVGQRPQVEGVFPHWRSR